MPASRDDQEVKVTDKLPSFVLPAPCASAELAALFVDAVVVYSCRARHAAAAAQDELEVETHPAATPASTSGDGHTDP